MRYFARIAALVVLSFFVFTAFTADVQASENYRDKKAVMVVIDRIDLEDIAGLPALKEIVHNGSVGLMNVRTSGTTTASKAYVTIGSGARAEGTPSAVIAVEADGEAVQVFYRRTGIHPAEGTVINPEINRLIAQNAEGEYGALPGTLGRYLHLHGFKTAVLGNGDCGENRIRWAAAIAMDREGIVDYGRVGKDVLLRDPLFPTGYRSDFRKVLSCLDVLWDKSNFMVIETGDITRIEESREFLSDDMYDYHRQAALERIDDFLSKVKEKVDLNKGLLIVATPYYSAERAKEGKKLTPLVIYGPGFSKGLLTSGTTRREGIVGNVDIAPTVLHYFGIKDAQVIGRPIKSIPEEKNLERIKTINQVTVNTSKFRYPVLSRYAIFVIFVILLGLVCVLCTGVFKTRLVALEKLFLMAVMMFPVVVLFIPLLKLQTLGSTGAAAVILTMGCAATLSLIKDTSRRLLVVSGLTSVAIFTDIVTGGNLIKVSLLGYDPIIGARYYGIGNEYMGVIVGSSLVMISSMLEENRMGIWTAAILLAVILAVIGYPGLGANVGGAITAFAAYSFFLIRLRKNRITLRHVLIIVTGIVTVVLAFAILDLQVLESHSHLAQALKNAVDRGPLYLLSIINRKIAMNLKLLKYTIWTKVLMTVIAVTGILLYKPVGIFKRVFSRYPNLAKGWSSIVVAAAVGMAVNDSGVVTSATSSIFFISSLLYVLIEEGSNKKLAAEIPEDSHGI